MGDDFIDNVKASKAREAALSRVNAAVQRPHTATNARDVTNYAATAIREECEKIETATKRNNQLNESLFSLGTLVGAGGLDRQVAEDALADAARRAGLPEKEIQKCLRDDGGMAAGMLHPRDMSDVGTLSNGTTFAVHTAPLPAPVLAFDEIEQGFWTSRKSLEQIYISALSKMCAPWSVLACCAARALATVRPHVTLPDIIGGPGSLNWFAAITATSGGGKGAASSTAKLLISDVVQQRNTGSGEGIIRAYIKPRKEDEPSGLHESLMFMVDEIDSLTAQARRNGATTMAVLRSAFSGETLGFSYVNNNTPVIDAHTYRMTMVVSVQPQRAADLLAEHHGGTPQRFMWFPGTDKRVTTDLAGGFVEPLTLPHPGAWQYPMAIQIPTAARDLILRERVKAMQGNVGALDGHALFVREKFAFALAVLDGRTSVSVEDWELSGIAAKVSDHTREWVAAMVAAAVDDDASERGRLHGVSAVASDDEKDWRIDVKRASITTLILKHLRAAAHAGLSKRQEQTKLGREAKWAGLILTQLEEDGRVRYDRDEDRYYIED